MAAVLRLVALCALPLAGLALALLADPFTAAWPRLLFGLQLALDDTARAFLGFSSLVWLAGGIHAHGYLCADVRRNRFALCYALAAAGGLSLPLAADAASFYLAFTLMTFAAYGLVVHDGSAAARAAGRVYLFFAVVSEMLLLVAMLMLAHAAGTLHIADMRSAAASEPVACWLLLAGFGTKAGVLLLHSWLPLAHPVAPTPASAVLSGAMIKAGVLGWLRFLPLGAVAMPATGELVIALGVAGAALGVLAGLLQRDAKTVLAYSSVSQMGYIVTAIGTALLAPSVWPLLLVAVLVYVVHHGLAKATLFLGVGLLPSSPVPRRLVLLALAVPALALAGAPLTGGALAKSLLKSALPAPVATLLTIAAVGTALLMARFLWLLSRAPHRREPAAGRMYVAAALLLCAVLAGPLPWLRLPDMAPAGAAIPHPELWPAAWPLLVATAALLTLAGWPPLRRRFATLSGWLPPGDVLGLLAPPLVAGWRLLLRLLARLDERRSPASDNVPAQWLAAAERRLRDGVPAALALLLVVLLLLAAG